MANTPRVYLLTGVAAAVVLSAGLVALDYHPGDTAPRAEAAASGTPQPGGTAPTGGDAGPSGTSGPSGLPPGSGGASVPSSTPPGTTGSLSAAAVPPSVTARGFTLVVHTARGAIPARVARMSVASNEPVDPPHATPEQWDTAVWVVQSAYPSAASGGTTYVYGHACHYHLCPFTNLKNAAVGDLITVSTPLAEFSYRVGRIGLSPKSATALPAWASDSRVPSRLVLVTCEFEQGDTSLNNIVVVANLVPAIPAGAAG